MDIDSNDIRQRAEWLWQQAGSPAGRDLEFWLAAEQSLQADHPQGDVPAEPAPGQADSSAPMAWSTHD